MLRKLFLKQKVHWGNIMNLHCVESYMRACKFGRFRCKSYFFFKWILFTIIFQVGESSLQSGNLYSPFMKMCRNLYLGGNQSDHGHTFRGSIGGLVLWDYERPHKDLLKLPHPTDRREPLLEIWSDFTKVIIGKISLPLRSCQFAEDVVLIENVLFNRCVLIHMSWVSPNEVENGR